MKDNLKKGSAIALLPLFIFIAVFMGISLVTKDFYAMPVTVPFLLAALVALFMNRKVSLDKKLDVFCKGAGEPNIILMCLIFILAGAFAEVAKTMGAVESTVNLGLTFLPSNILVAGVFIATGIAAKTGIPIALVVGAVVGGAMFGDNLSMISDTTIAATRTQGCDMRDKFRMNFKVVLPAAIITTLIFTFITLGQDSKVVGDYSYSLVKVLPYVGVLLAALLGVNVLLVLVGGILFAGSIGIFTGAFDIIGLLQAIGKGIGGMSELVIISMIIGGMVEIIKFNGGIEFILGFITKRVNSKIGAEFGIATLVSLVDICTANNTIAIVTVGPIAKDISNQYDICFLVCPKELFLMVHNFYQHQH